MFSLPVALLGHMQRLVRRREKKTQQRDRNGAERRPDRDRAGRSRMAIAMNGPVSLLSARYISGSGTISVGCAPPRRIPSPGVPSCRSIDSANRTKRTTWRPLSRFPLVSQSIFQVYDTLTPTYTHTLSLSLSLTFSLTTLCSIVHSPPPISSSGGGGNFVHSSRMIT